MNKELLHEMFNYDSDTGNFIHKKTVKGGKRKGDIAGSPHNCGYLQITINGNKYLLHRLIFMYFYGRWPNQIDHINGRRSDNRIENIRECDFSKNHGNKRLNRNNTSGYKGVFYIKSSGRWMTYVAHKYIGTFKTKEEAAQAYDNSAKSHYGEFALTNSRLKRESNV